MANAERRIEQLEAADFERRLEERLRVKWSPDLSELRDLAGAIVDPWALDAHFQAGGIVDFDWSNVEAAQVDQLQATDEGERAGYAYEVLKDAPIVRMYRHTPPH
jgi:hypothetical protein